MSSENLDSNLQNRTQVYVASHDEASAKDLFLNIQRWFRFLLLKWKIIILYGIIGGILGFAYAYFQKPLYTATCTFVLEESNSGGGGLASVAGLASMAGFDLGGGGGGIFQGDNIMELYKSRTMLEKTLLSAVVYNGKPQLLIDRYITFNKLRDRWAKKPELANINFNNNVNQPFTRLQDSIIINIVEKINKDYLVVTKPDKKLSIIDVAVKCGDEFFSKEFNDKIVKNVNDFYVQTKTKKSLQNVVILQHQTDSVKNVLNGALYTSASVMDATPNLNATRQSLRTPVQKSQFNADANKAILTELVKNLELSKISLRKETPLIQVVDAPIYPLKRDKVSKAGSIIAGGFLLGFLSIIILSVRQIYQRVIMS